MWQPTVMAKADYSLFANCLVLPKFIPWTNEVNGLELPTFHLLTGFCYLRFYHHTSWYLKRSPATFCDRVSWKTSCDVVHTLDSIPSEMEFPALSFHPMSNTRSALWSDIFSLCTPEQTFPEDSWDLQCERSWDHRAENNNLPKGPVLLECEWHIWNAWSWAL